MSNILKNIQNWGKVCHIKDLSSAALMFVKSVKRTPAIYYFFETMSTKIHSIYTVWQKKCIIYLNSICKNKIFTKC